MPQVPLRTQAERESRHATLGLDRVPALQAREPLLSRLAREQVVVVAMDCAAAAQLVQFVAEVSQPIEYGAQYLWCVCVGDFRKSRCITA